MITHACYICMSPIVHIQYGVLELMSIRAGEALTSPVSSPAIHWNCREAHFGWVYDLLSSRLTV